MLSHFSESRDDNYVSSAMCPGRWARHVLLATPTGKRPRVNPRTRWSDYISDLAWSCLTMEPTELSEIAVDREVFRVLIQLLPS